jgi:DNA invertase Pin-like site-specific DNA recombinase
LAPSVVIKIFKASGTYREIADRFSISLSTVHSIKKKKRWKKVTDGVAQ